ncbi:MAG: hypothetical protein ACJA2S_002739 [Cyclobacteriaceae bacterium]|jgi:hypothetical protein
MKAATLRELKNELGTVEKKQLLDLCLRLSKYKKDNKELLTYLLFEAHDEQGYIASIKREIDEQMSALNRNNLYYTKKGLRKILRTAAKFIRYSGQKETAVEVLIYFCSEVKHSGIPIQRSKVLINMYEMQLKKIRTALATLHEDLQYDYKMELEQLEL